MTEANETNGIIGLTVENFMGVKAVKIKPELSSPIISLSGDNGAGKTSLMDSIAVAIGGTRLSPENPIRTGENEASINVELENLIVERKFKRTDKGIKTTLKVTSKDVGRLSSGQSVLNELIGELTFDPLGFIRESPKSQFEIISRMVDVNLEYHDVLISDAYLARTNANREEARLKTGLNRMTKHDGDYELVSVSGLTQKVIEANDAENKRKSEKRILDNLKNALRQCDERIERLADELANEKTVRDNLANDVIPKQVTAVETIIVPNVSKIQIQIDEAEDNNQKHRDNKAYDRAKALHDNSIVTCKRLDDKVKDLRADKIKAIKEATYPVSGLELGENIVLYNNVPLSQISKGEQITLSTRIAMEQNPKLKVLMIRDGSLLGTKNFEIIESLATENNYQIWVEYVDTTGEIGFYLEEGELA